MKIEFKRLDLRPYPGQIFLFNRLDFLRAKYTSMTGLPYDWQDEPTGGRYIRVEGEKAKDTIWLVYGRKPHVLAHEFTHVLLQTFERIGTHPADGNGEPFCYLLSQLMIDAR